MRVICPASLPPLERRLAFLQEGPPGFLCVLRSVENPTSIRGHHIVVSMELSRAARMMRLLIHCTMGGVRMMRSHSARVVSSSFSAATR